LNSIEPVVGGRLCDAITMMCDAATVLCDAATVLCDAATVLCDAATVLCDTGTVLWVAVSITYPSGHSLLTCPHRNRRQRDGSPGPTINHSRS
jgi:hypothetical protein